MKISKETLASLPNSLRLQVVSAGNQITELRKQRYQTEREMMQSGIDAVRRSWLVGEFGRINMQIAYLYRQYGQYEDKT